jgi:hypothetical protein|tara:strand:- start:42 stop:878 length:837 start_codon:yes stop_codon:yes gene_type:complete
MRKIILKRFSKKFKGTQKLPAQTIPKQSSNYEGIMAKSKSDKIRNVFGSDPTKQPVISLRTEKARKIGRLVEDRSHRSLTKKVESAFVRTALKPNKQNQFANLVKQKNNALIKAFKVSQTRGLKAGEKASVKLGLDKGAIYAGARDKPKSFFKKKSFISAEESRKLGFPQSEMSLSARYDLDLPNTSAKSRLKKTRSTLSKIYKSPKSWKDRSKLKRQFRLQAKSELGEAKIDRAFYRTSTIQKQNPKSKKYSTIWSETSRRKPLIKEYVQGGKVKWK